MVPARRTAARSRLPTNSLPKSAARFDARERSFLLRQRGIAEGVLAGLEALGVGTLEELAAIGADELCRRMQVVHGWDVWGNRRRMLQAAIDAAAALRGGVEPSGRARSGASLSSRSPGQLEHTA